MRPHEKYHGSADHCFLTQEQIAADWGITRARVHQIEKKALEKLRIAIQRECRTLGITLAEWAGIE
jgi:DNA-directed RNA polymerase sigma subunit (sigma70/sigma32)